MSDERPVCPRCRRKSIYFLKDGSMRCVGCGYPTEIIEIKDAHPNSPFLAAEHINKTAEILDVRLFKERWKYQDLGFKKIEPLYNWRKHWQKFKISRETGFAFRYIINIEKSYILTAPSYQSLKKIGCCGIYKRHHDLLKDDPERLTTDFIKKLSRCECNVRT